MNSNLKWILAALAAIAFVAGCLGVAANGQGVPIAQTADSVLNRLIHNDRGVIVKDDGQTTSRQIKADRSTEEATAAAEAVFEKWPKNVAASQVTAQPTMPTFIAGVRCSFCERGKDVAVDLWTTKDIELPGATITWRLLRPGKTFKHAEGDRITYGVAETVPFPGVLSRVVSYVNYSNLIKIRLTNDSDTAPGEYLLDIIIQHWDGRTIQHIRTRFFVGRTADGESRGVDSVDYVVPTQQGGAIFYGSFIAGARYAVVHMDSQGVGTFSYGYSADGKALFFPGQVWQWFETGVMPVIANLDTGEHFSAPPTVIKRYGRN